MQINLNQPTELTQAQVMRRWLNELRAEEQREPPPVTRKQQQWLQFLPVNEADRQASLGGSDLLCTLTGNLADAASSPRNTPGLCHSYSFSL